MKNRFHKNFNNKIVNLPKFIQKMNPQKINELEQKINNLLYRQTVVYNEIKQLENE